MITPKPTYTFFVPLKHFHSTVDMLKEQKVKHWPFERTYHGYFITIDDGPLASYFTLKYN